MMRKYIAFSLFFFASLNMVKAMEEQKDVEKLPSCQNLLSLAENVQRGDVDFNQLTFSVDRMIIEDKAQGIHNSVKNDASYQALNDLYKNHKLNPETKVSAAFMIAFSHYYGEMSQVSDEEAFSLFDEVSQAKESPLLFKSMAKVHKGLLRFNHRSKAITDEEAFKLFDEVSKDPQADLVSRTKAALWKGFYRESYRTEIINDEEAFQIFDKVSRNPHVFAYDRDQALYHKALFRYWKRTQAISDEEAFDLFHFISQSQEICQVERAKAILYKAKLRYEGRTQALTDKATITMLCFAVIEDTFVKSVRLAMSELITLFLKRNK